MRLNLTGRINEGWAGARGSARRVARVVAVAAGIVLALLVFSYAIQVLLVVFAGLLLAVALHTLSTWLEQLSGLPHRAAFTIVILGLALLAGGAGWLLAPQISDQVDEISQRLPQSVDAISRWLEQYGWGRALLSGLPSAPDELGVEALGTVGTLFSSLFSAAAAVLFILFIGVYVAAEPDKYRRGLLHLVPLDHRRRVGEVLGLIHHSLQWWLVAQFVSMAFLGVSVSILLWALDIPLALTLGLLVGALTFIPYMGPIIGFVPIALLALAADPFRALAIVPAYVAIQSTEGYFVTPMVQRKAVLLPPALTLSFQLFMGVLVGIFGFVLATPLLVVTMVATQQFYVAWLGDRTFADKGRDPAG